MNKRILIIDDEAEQVRALYTILKEKLGDGTEFITASTEEEIESCINDKFYNLAILDIRMDNYSKNGIDLAKEIIEINPFAKIIFVSKFLTEYMDLLNDIMGTGRILAFSEKKEYTSWMNELVPIINKYYDNNSYTNEVNKALQETYANAKNETDTYKKGVMFEDFVALLFRSIGYNEVIKRVKDLSLNEVDLIVRNDIDDKFLSDFGQYILIECKNKISTKVNKNDFIIFKSKIDATCGMSKLGFIFTTSSITGNTYIEAVRESRGDSKIILVDNIRMNDLLQSSDIKEGLKKIIDSQVKDN